jgi:HD-GYP domain-containing protein (c-di-GMP phosphodiesterase class II)
LNQFINTFFIAPEINVLANIHPAVALRGDIFLFARIICIADVHDALTEDRPYRKAWKNRQVLRFFEEQKEKMFDPELVDIFMSTFLEKNN